MEQNIKLSKLDVVRRQTETAIRLYFFEEDPVSLHTLAAASHEIVRDVTKKTCASPMLLEEAVNNYIYPERKDEFITALNKARNFFKHANHDHDATLDFNPIQTEFLLLDVCIQYQKLTSELPPLMRAYLAWFMLNNKSLFRFPNEVSQQLDSVAKDWVGKSRQSFSTEAVPFFMNMEVSDIEAQE